MSLIDYNAIPENLKDLINSADLEDKITEIVEKNKLHVDVAGDMYDSVRLVLAGKLLTKNFIGDLEKNAGLTHEQAITVAEDVNKQIFMPVRAELQRVTEQKRDNPEEAVIVQELLEKPSQITTHPIVPTPSVEESAVQPPYKVMPPKLIIATKLVVPLPVPTPSVKETPTLGVAQVPAIHEQKAVAPVSVPPAVTDFSHINMDPRVKLVPDDVKQRINSDPYKESI